MTTPLHPMFFALTWLMNFIIKDVVAMTVFFAIT